MCTCGVWACRRTTPPTPDPAAAESARPRLVGRFARVSSPEGGGEIARFAWSASTVEARFTGASSIAMRLRAAPLEPHTVVVDGKEVRLDEKSTAYSVSVDGRPPTTIEVSHERERHELAAGLDPQAAHEIRIVREAEAFAGVHELLGLELDGRGRFLPPRERARRLELVGDSIMCGYGVLGADAKCPFTYATERASAAYPALVARALDADATVLCWSGRGVHRNYDGSTAETMPVLYERTLPAPPGTPFPFASAPEPHAVVIGLGTNDLLGGGGVPLDIEAFEASYLRFLRLVRELRPRASIVVVTSPMLEGARRAQLRSSLERVVAVRHGEGDARLDVIELEHQGKRVGCDAHPNAEMHRALAARLEAALRTRLPGGP